MPELDDPFHKLRRISEKDIVPDDSTYAELPESAEEGRIVALESGSNYTFYKWLRGAWHELSGGGNGWQLVANEHADPGGSTSLDITGLTGDTDEVYHLIMRAEFNTTESALVMRMNGDGTFAYENAAGTFSQQQMTLSLSAGDVFWIDMLIYAKSGKPRLVKWTIYGSKPGISATIDTSGASWTNDTDELTDLNFSATTNFMPESEYWLYKAV